MRKVLTLLFAASFFITIMFTKAYAQDENIVNLQAEVRVDYQYEALAGDKTDANTGFKVPPRTISPTR